MSAVFWRWIDGRPYEVRWNGSATFNVYADRQEVDVFTHYGKGEPARYECTLVEAAGIARTYLDELARHPDNRVHLDELAPEVAGDDYTDPIEQYPVGVAQPWIEGQP